MKTIPAAYPFRGTLMTLFFVGVSSFALVSADQAQANPQASFSLGQTIISTVTSIDHPQAQKISLVSSTISASQPSETLVRELGEQAISFLTNQNLSESARQNAFRDLLVNNFDLKTIGRFALGRYWREASLEQRNEYLNLFEDMIINVYSQRFGEYSGQELQVTGSRPDGEKDTIVRSVVVSPKGGADINVDWRVRSQKDGSQKIIDVIVEGVSMSVTQRSDFSSVIQRGGGEIDVLLAHLRQ